MMNRIQIRNTIRNWFNPPACLLFAIWVFVLVWNLVTQPFTDSFDIDKDFYFDALTLGVNFLLPVWMGWHAGIRPFRAGAKATAILYSLALLNLSLLIWEFAGDVGLSQTDYVIAHTWIFFFGPFVALTLMAWWFPKTWCPIESKKNQRRMSIRTYLIWLLLSGVIFAELTNGAALFQQVTDIVIEMAVALMVLTMFVLVVLGPVVGHLIRTPRVWTWALFYSLIPFWLAASIVVWFRVQPEGLLAKLNETVDWETGLFFSSVYTGLYLGLILLALIERWRNQREKLKNGPDTPVLWQRGNGWVARIAKFSLVVPFGWFAWWIGIHAYQASHYNKYAPQREVFTAMTGVETNPNAWPLDDYFNRITELAAAKDNLCVPLYRYARMPMTPEHELGFCQVLGIEPNLAGTKKFAKFSSWSRDNSQTDRTKLFAVEDKSTSKWRIELDRASPTLLQDVLPYLDSSDYDLLLTSFCLTDADVRLGADWAQEVEPLLERFISELPNHSRFFAPVLVYEGGFTYFYEFDALFNFGYATLSLGNRAIGTGQTEKAIRYRQSLNRMALIVLRQAFHRNLIEAGRLCRRAAGLSLRLAQSRALGEADYRSMQLEWHELMLASEFNEPLQINLTAEAIRLDGWFSSVNLYSQYSDPIGIKYLTVRIPAIVDWKKAGLKCREKYLQDFRSIDKDAPIVEQMIAIRNLIEDEEGDAEGQFIDGLVAWIGAPADKANWVAMKALRFEMLPLSPFYGYRLYEPNLFWRNPSGENSRNRLVVQHFADLQCQGLKGKWFLEEGA